MTPLEIREMSNLSKSRVKSTWTPLVNQNANFKIFYERADLVYKWYEKWSDVQRREVLDGLLDRSRYSQLVYTRNNVARRCPPREKDFTRYLPRALSLYIFSYLDPLSLCRCAEVSWSWKYLSELDLLWLPKCVRIGWFLPFSPTPYEQGVWKRLYLENVKNLRIYRNKMSAGRGRGAGANAKRQRPWASAPSRPHAANSTISDVIPAPKPPPWRATTKHPSDTRRYNYLNNDDGVPETRKNPSFRKSTIALQASRRLSKSLNRLSLEGDAIDVRRPDSRAKRPASAVPCHNGALHNAPPTPASLQFSRAAPGGAGGGNSRASSETWAEVSRAGAVVNGSARPATGGKRRGGPRSSAAERASKMEALMQARSWAARHQERQGAATQQVAAVTQVALDDALLDVHGTRRPAWAARPVLLTSSHNSGKAIEMKPSQLRTRPQSANGVTAVRKTPASRDNRDIQDAQEKAVVRRRTRTLAERSDTLSIGSSTGAENPVDALFSTAPKWVTHVSNP